MRHVLPLILVTLASPAAADGFGPPTGQFAASWSAPPTSQFTPWDKVPTVRSAVGTRAPVPDSVMRDAFAAAADADARRDLALEEMADAFEPAQHVALEDLRDAERAYATAAGGDRAARNAQFAMMVHDLVEGRGRSVAHDDAADSRLAETYGGAIRDLSDADRSALQALQTAWDDYRDAFGRFAQAMERPDAVASLRDDLARRRAEELHGPESR